MTIISQKIVIMVKISNKGVRTMTDEYDKDATLCDECNIRFEFGLTRYFIGHTSFCLCDECREKIAKELVKGELAE